MSMTPKELLRLLLRNGWQIINQEGSHIKLRKENYETIILPMHNRDLAPGLLNKILKQAGIKLI